MKITGLDEIAEEGLTLDTGFKLYNRAKTAYIEATTTGFNTVGTHSETITYTVGPTGNATLTAAQHIGGVYSVAAGATNDTITTLTAALLVAAFPGIRVGQAVPLVLVNLKATANTVTAAGGTGVTTVGYMIMAQNVSGSFKLLFTNVSTGTEAVQLIRVA